MAKKEMRATAKLFLDTSNATSDAKQFVADLKTKLREIETAADKMTVFKDLAGYIGEIDKSLAALKAKDGDAFVHMFDGMDEAFKKEFENIFKISKEKVTEINAIRGLLDGATQATPIEDLKQWQSTIKEIYSLMGKEIKFKSRSNPTNMINEMKVAVDGFAVVWQDLMKRMSEGFQLGGTGVGSGSSGIASGVSSVSAEVQQQIDTLNGQVDELKNVKSKFVQVFRDIANMQKEGVGSLSDDYSVELTVDAVQSLMDEFDALEETMKSGDKTSAEYYRNLIRMAEISVIFNKAMSDIRNNGDIKEKFMQANGGPGHGGNMLGKLSSYSNKKGIFTQLNNVKNDKSIDKLIQAKTDEANALLTGNNKVQESNKNVGISYQELGKKIKEYYQLAKQYSDESLSDREQSRISNKMERLGKELTKLGDTDEKIDKISETLSKLENLKIDDNAATNAIAGMLGITEAAQQATEAVETMHNTVGGATASQRPQNTQSQTAQEVVDQAKIAQALVKQFNDILQEIQANGIESNDSANHYEGVLDTLEAQIEELYNLGHVTEEVMKQIYEAKKMAMSFIDGTRETYNTINELAELNNKASLAQDADELENIVRQRAQLIGYAEEQDMLSAEALEREKAITAEIEKRVQALKEAKSLDASEGNAETVTKAELHKLLATVYHGSQFSLKGVDYDVSKSRGRRNLGDGMYFTPDIELAAKHGKNILKQSVDMDKIFILTKDFITDIDALYEAMGKVKPENVDWDTIKKDLHGAMQDAELTKKFAEHMQKLGYHGVYSKGYGYADENAEQMVLYDDKYKTNMTTTPYKDMQEAGDTVLATQKAINAEIERQQSISRQNIDTTSAQEEKKLDAQKSITAEMEKQNSLQDDDSESDLARENGLLEQKRELLAEIAQEYGNNITQKIRNRYEELNDKEMSDAGLTAKEEEKQWELGEQILEADENLEKFGETYDKIILKLSNGSKVEILPDDAGLRKLYKLANESYDADSYNGHDIEDITFVRHEQYLRTQIESYEELCQVVKRFNELRNKDRTLHENVELKAIMDRFTATIGDVSPEQGLINLQKFSHIMKTIGDIDAKDMADYLGIQIPLEQVQEAAEQTNQALQEQLQTQRHINEEADEGTSEKQVANAQETTAALQQTESAYEGATEAAKEYQAAISNTPPSLTPSGDGTALAGSPIDNPPGTAAGGTPPPDGPNETEQMRQLAEAIEVVTGAVNNKTAAFRAEAVAVGEVVTQEIVDLNRLQERLSALSDTIKTLFDKSIISDNIFEAWKSDLASVESSLAKISDVLNGMPDASKLFDGMDKIEDAASEQRANAMKSIFTPIEEAMNKIHGILAGFTGLEASAEGSIAKKKPVTDGATTNSEMQRKLTHDIATEATLQSVREAINNLTRELTKPKDDEEVNALKSAINELAMPLLTAVKSLHDVANGIVQHQKAQKTNTIDATQRLMDSQQRVDISSSALAAGGKLGTDPKLYGLTALKDGLVQVEGAFKNATGEWEGFTVKVNESNEAVDLAIKKQSAFAKELNRTGGQLDENAVKYNPEETYKKALEYQKKLEDEWATQGVTNKKATLQYKDSGRHTLSIEETIGGLTRTIFQTFDETQTAMQRTTVTVSNALSDSLAKSHREIIRNSKDVVDTDGLTRYNAEYGKLITLNEKYAGRDNLTQAEQDVWNDQINLVQKLGDQLQILIKTKGEALNNKKLQAFQKDADQLLKGAGLDVNSVTDDADGQSALNIYGQITQMLDGFKKTKTLLTADNVAEIENLVGALKLATQGYKNAADAAAELAAKNERLLQGRISTLQSLSGQLKLDLGADDLSDDAKKVKEVLDKLYSMKASVGTTSQDDIDSLQKEANRIIGELRSSLDQSKQKAKDDAAAKAFGKLKDGRLDAFDKYQRDVERSTTLTDDLKKSLNQLRSSLANVGDETGLKEWEKSFEDVQAKIAQHKKDRKNIYKVNIADERFDFTKVTQQINRSVGGLGFNIHDRNLVDKDAKNLQAEYYKTMRSINKLKAKLSTGESVDLEEQQFIYDFYNLVDNYKKDQAKKKADQKLADQKTDRTTSLDDYISKTQKSIMLTQELSKELDSLKSSLKGASDADSLTAWDKQFSAFRDQVNDEKKAQGKTKRTQEKIDIRKQTRGIDNTIKELNAAMGGLDFKTTDRGLIGIPAEIKAEYDKVIATLDKYKARIQGGESVELDSITKTIDALHQKINVYKSAMKVADAMQSRAKKQKKTQEKIDAGQKNLDIANRKRQANSLLSGLDFKKNDVGLTGDALKIVQDYNHIMRLINDAKYSESVDFSEIDQEIAKLKELTDARKELNKQDKIKQAQEKNSTSRTLSGLSNDLKRNFKELNFNEDSEDLNAEQQRIVDKYKELTKIIGQSQVAVQKGGQADVEAIEKETNALLQQIQAYKERNNIRNAKGGTASTFGLRQVQNAAGKYNSLMAGASDVGIDKNYTDVQNFVNAYKKLIAAQKEFKAGEDLTTNIGGIKIAAFREAQAEFTKYSQALNKIITETRNLQEMGENEVPLSPGFEDTLQGRRDALRKYVTDMHGASAEQGNFSDSCRKMAFTVKNADGTFTSMTASINVARNSIIEVAGDVKKVESVFSSLTSTIGGKWKELWIYASARLGVDEIIQAVRSGFQQVLEIDTALTELKKVTDETGSAYDAFLQKMSQTGSVVGSTVSNLTTMAAEWARLGYSLEEAGMLAESTAILMNVSEFDDATAASEALISTMQAFGYVAEDSQHVVDILNEIGNSFAVSSDGIATALKDSASALMEGGNSMEQAVALVAAANKVVQDPNSVGKQLCRR